MMPVPPELAAASERFLDLVAELRPELHRYASRLVGSAIDGEDVVQESLAKAYYALSLSPEVPPLRPWLLRITHNTAIDFLRRYERRFVEAVADVPENEAPQSDEDAVPLRLSLSSFFVLPVLQRSAVILKDVLDCSLEEVAATLGTTVPAVKAALVRGRRTLRALPKPDVVPWRDRPETSPKERELLERYVALFNRQDWAAVQGLLAEEVRLDLVAKSDRRGKGNVSLYFGNYAKRDCRLVRGHAEGRAVLGVFVPAASTVPAYVVSLDWDGDQVCLIRDYRYVPYLMHELSFHAEGESP